MIDSVGNTDAYVYFMYVICTDGFSLLFMIRLITCAVWMILWTLKLHIMPNVTSTWSICKNNWEGWLTFISMIHTPVPLFSPSVKLWCKHMYIVISIFKPPVVTVPLSPPAFHPHSLITISRVAAPPPVSQFPRHRRPPHFPLCHQTRPHPRSTSSAAPRAPARPVCCTTTTLPAAVSSLCSLMRCAFIILFRLA